jgi:cyclohexa-1,5-dienecarbonyl-CoA hydratase
MSSTLTVRETYDSRVREFRIGGTRGNLITEALVEAMRTALKDAAAAAHVKLIIVTGEGRDFSYGADIKEHLPAHIHRVLPAFHVLIGEMLQCDVPTLARVSGYCLGGGFEIALACSMIWCDETAKIGLPEISLGVFPPAAAVLLPEKTSGKVASEMVLTGRTLSAAEAKEMGIVNELVPIAELRARLNHFIVNYVLPKSASSLRIANAALRERVRRRYAEDIAATESIFLRQLMGTHDAVEGARAFLEKRVPDWKDA